MTLTPGECQGMHVLTLLAMSCSASMAPGGSRSTTGSLPAPRPPPIQASSEPRSAADAPPAWGADIFTDPLGGHIHWPTTPCAVASLTGRGKYVSVTRALP